MTDGLRIVILRVILLCADHSYLDACGPKYWSKMGNIQALGKSCGSYSFLIWMPLHYNEPSKIGVKTVHCSDTWYSFRSKKITRCVSHLL